MPSCMTLKKSNCKSCHKCIRYCPVKAIRFSGNQAYIIGNECILCGKCFVVCPQNAKQIVNETEKVKLLLQSSVPVIASISPSFIANYHNVGINSIKTAVKKLGFFDAEETAIGATIVKREYERLLNEVDRDIVISSSCHSINLLIQKYYPVALEYLADVISPMQAHCLDIKKRYPDAKTVFIGPCIAKKDEAKYYENTVDAVLTFEEFDQWLKEENIELEEEELDVTENSKARLFPITGGIIKTMSQDNTEFNYLSVDGVQNCMSVLKDIEDGKIHKCFIEMSACEGNCINGPAMSNPHKSLINDYLSVINYAGKEDFIVEQPPSYEIKKTFSYIKPKLLMPSEAEINSVLRQMGKFNVTQELNCGSCGYDTCREKAIAVCQGKAEISMCIPFLKDRAESFSDTIINNTPNGIFVLNENLEVQQINDAALKIMNIRCSSDILGSQVIRVLDPTPFIRVMTTGKDIKNERIYLTEYNRYVEQIIVYTKDSHVLICIMRDVTDDEHERERKEKINQHTIEVADKVVDKQMRIVQEIASLLGETAAETKIALTKLKETISNE